MVAHGGLVAAGRQKHHPGLGLGIGAVAGAGSGYFRGPSGYTTPFLLPDGRGRPCKSGGFMTVPDSGKVLYRGFSHRCLGTGGLRAGHKAGDGSSTSSASGLHGLLNYRCVLLQMKIFTSTL